MANWNWRGALAVVSAGAALAAAVLAVVAVFDRVGWPVVIAMATAAVACAIPALLTNAGQEAESRGQ